MSSVVGKSSKMGWITSDFSATFQQTYIHTCIIVLLWFLLKKKKKKRATLVTFIEACKLSLEKNSNNAIQTASDHFLHFVGSASAFLHCLWASLSHRLSFRRSIRNCCRIITAALGSRSNSESAKSSALWAINCQFWSVSVKKKIMKTTASLLMSNPIKAKPHNENIV